MKVHKFNNNLKFGRALTTEERKDFIKVQEQVKKVIGNDGINILIVQDTCLPIDESDNVGVGNLGNKKALEFFDLMKTYMGINAVKVLPQGEMLPMKKKSGLFYCNYTSTALSLGIQNIDLERLTGDKYGNILSKNDLKKVVDVNNLEKQDELINLSNVLPKDRSNKELAMTPFIEALDKAYENFITYKPKLLTQRFEEYKLQNKKRLEPKALYEILRKKYANNNPYKWGNDESAKIDINLYNPDYDEIKRNERIEKLKKENEKEIDKYYFEQFLADEHLSENRQKLHEKNLKLFGDCLIGFSYDEVWAHPKAFEKGSDPKFPFANIGWGLPALNYSQIKDEKSDANKLLMEKVEFFAKRYDGIRFDVGWAYVSPSINDVASSVKQNYKNKKNGVYTLDMGENLLNRIEKKVKEVKGDKFNKDDLIFEVEASPDDFSIFPKGFLRNEFKNHKFVQSTAYVSPSYATTLDLKKRGVDDDGYIYMTNNHDHISLQRLSQKNEFVNNSYDSLNQNLNERVKLQKEALIEELHLNPQNANLDKPSNFVRAKFAQIKMAKNNKVFYMDIYGKAQQFNAQELNDVNNFRYKIPYNFEQSYHQSLQNKTGLNIMDAYQKVMKAKGLDNKYKLLYKKVKNFAKILYEKGPLSEAQANREIILKK